MSERLYCVYCGSPMVHPTQACCGEVHFVTEAELDKDDDPLYGDLGDSDRSDFDGCRTKEDDRLDDPRHGQADAINRGR